MAVTAVAAAQGFKYCGVYLSMLYIGYDKPCNIITIDAAAAAVMKGARRPTAVSLLKVRGTTLVLLRQHYSTVTALCLACLQWHACAYAL
jgi:hypothetical protein